MESPVLSTMVVLYKTNLEFDTTKLLNTLPLNDEIIKIEKKGLLRRGESKRDRIKRRSKKDETNMRTGFCQNSITTVIMNNGDGTLPMKEVTIKIFRNGVFHMTGIPDEKYDYSSIARLLSLIWENCSESFLNAPEKYEIINRRVALMNYTTKIIDYETIARESLHKAIRNMDSKFNSQYNPDVYPGVKISYDGTKWLAKIFRTRKVILTGLTSREDCAEFTKLMSELLVEVLPKSQKPSNTSCKVAQL